MDDFYGPRQPAENPARKENKEIVSKLVQNKAEVLDQQNSAIIASKTQRTPQPGSIRKQDSYTGLLSDTQNFEERYIMKQDEDSEFKKLGLSYEPLDNSLNSYSVNQSFNNI